MIWSIAARRKVDDFTKRSEADVPQSDKAFINQVFLSVLGRSADDKAIVYYCNEYCTSAERRVDAILRAMSSTEARESTKTVWELINLLDDTKSWLANLEYNRFRREFRRVLAPLRGLEFICEYTPSLETHSNINELSQEKLYSFTTSREGDFIRLAGWYFAPEKQEVDSAVISFAEKNVGELTVQGGELVKVNLRVDLSEFDLTQFQPLRIHLSRSADVLFEDQVGIPFREMLLAESKRQVSLELNNSENFWEITDTNFIESRDSIRDDDLLTPYVCHLAAAKGGPQRIEDEVAEYEYAFMLLEWYLTDWVEKEHAAGNLPITPSQINFVLEPCIEPQMTVVPITRHIFWFARKHNLLEKLLSGASGLAEVYVKFLQTRLGGKASMARLVPPDIISYLNAQVSSTSFPINRFWKLVIEGDLRRADDSRGVEELSAIELAEVCAKHLVSSVRFGTWLDFIPQKWIELLSEQSIAGDEPMISEREDFLKFDRAQPRMIQLGLFQCDQLREDERIGLRRRLIKLGEKFYGEVDNRCWLIGHQGSTGLGNNRKMLQEAVEFAGYPVTSVKIEQPLSQQIYKELKDTSSLKKPLALFAVNADRCCEELARLPNFISEKSKKVGFFLWETSLPPANHLASIEYLDEIWTPTEYVHSIYDKVAPSSLNTVNIGKFIRIPKIDTEFDRQKLGLAPNDFVFLTISDFDSSIIRKHPLPAIKAFRKAFPANIRNVKLIVKVRNINTDHWSNQDGYWDECMRFIRNDERIVLYEGDLSEREYWSLLRSANCFVSTHRAEGFGYGAAHSLGLGVPVITSDYSGVQDFCTNDSAFLVSGEEVDVLRGQMRNDGYVGKWFEPDVDSCAAEMVRVIEDVELRKLRVKTGETIIRERYSLERFSQRIRARIECLAS